MHEHTSYTAPISHSLHEFTMHSESPTTTPATSPAKPHHQDKHNDTPDHLPTKLSVLTNDFYLDTHFNPVWTPGPHVFSFAKDGTVVRPEMYSLEPYPGYHACRHRHLESVNASHFQGFSTQEKKPWKNVAITEQDDAEFAAIQADSSQCSVSDGEEPELVYTWPPTPMGNDDR